MKYRKHLFLAFFLFVLMLSNCSFAAYTSAYPEPTTSLRMGASGSTVKWLQDLLSQIRISS